MCRKAAALLRHTLDTGDGGRFHIKVSQETLCNLFSAMAALEIFGLLWGQLQAKSLMRQ